MKAAGLKRGVFIVMNPQTGEVLALVSLPSYDNNLFARGISNKAFQKLLNDPNKPLTNHAVQAHYPPGSTYKLVAGTGGLQDKKITATTKLRTRGYLTLSGARFYDWNRRGFGLCDIKCGFGHSSDTFFFQVAGMLGADRLAYWAPHVRLRQADRHRSAGRGRRASSRPTSGRSTPSASRCSGARSTSPASARATTW